jgi:D-cysteine desulfhydrase
MKIEFPSRVPLAHTPTPITRLNRLSQKLGVEILVKREDLTGCALSGNKIRKLEFVMADAMKQGADTIVTCGKVQSNHARATALACARLGLNCRLILRVEDPESPLNPEGNLLLDRVAGAGIIPIDYDRWPDRDAIMADEFARINRNGGSAYIIPFGASTALGAWGEIQASRELRQDVASLPGGVDVPTSIVMASGTGGALGGYLLGTRLFELPFNVVGINVDDREFIQNTVETIRQQARTEFGIDAGLRPGEGYEIVDGYLGRGYALSRPVELEFISVMGRLEGLVLDPVYTAKALLGLVCELTKDPRRFGERVIFIHTGGIFHLFIQNPELTQTLNNTSPGSDALDRIIETVL